MVALANTPELSVNRQGLAQHDLSVRGSSYTGAGISINGLNLRVPHDAHFNSELPFPSFLLSAPQVRTGLDNASGHLVGTAAYTTVPLGNGGEASTGIGTKEHYSTSVSAFSAGLGGFAEWEKARRIDYAANDLDRQAGGAHVQYFANGWQVDAIGAYQEKEFGAQGYYGSSAYAEQQTEDALVFFGATHGEPDDAFFRASAAWRQFDDEYLLAGVERNIRSRFGTAAVEGRTMEIQQIALNLRGDLEHEQVDGGLSDDHTRVSLLLLPEARLERFTIKAGLNTVFQSDESAEWLPQAGVDWFATDNIMLYGTYSETVRQPDDLTLAANPLLQPQKAHNAELGIRQFVSARLDWRAATFRRRLENASDWIGGSVVDLGTLNVTGVDSTISYYPSNGLKLTAFYQWLHKDNDLENGLYETDYPEHLLNFAGRWIFAPGLELFAAQTLRYQADNDNRSGNDFGADAVAGLHWVPRFANNARLSLRVDNLWGSDFQPIPGLKPRPTTVFSGITVTW
jgi:outer membrane receptor protein involved in Fe transport